MKKSYKNAVDQSLTRLTPTWAKGIKPELLTMIDLSRGIIAGLIADKYLGRHFDTFEAALRPYFLAVAHKRGFASYLEFKLPRDSAIIKGAHKKLDYVFTYGRQFMAIECKTVCDKTRPINKIKIQNDIDKLKDIASIAPLPFRSSSWLVVAEICKKSSILDFAKHPPIKSLLGTLNVNFSDLHTDEELLINRERKVKDKMTFVTTGSVGSYKAWCIVSCIESP